MPAPTSPRLARMFWLHALSSVHVGAGRGVGYIDLPVVREQVTRWPYIPTSAVKGVLADRHRAEDCREKLRTQQALSPNEQLVVAAFGNGGDDSANSGSLIFADARLVSIPVPSLIGTFAWCTSPLALARLARDLEAIDGTQLPSIPRLDLSKAIPAQGVVSGVDVTSAVLLAPAGRVYLLDLDLELVADAAEQANALQWAERIASAVFPQDTEWQRLFCERFVVLSDTVFNFLTKTATEVRARVRLEDETKTVARGALWYEESLPAEAILAGLVACDRVFGAKRSGVASQPQDLLNKFCAAGAHSEVQLGGKATVGYGRMRLLFDGATAVPTNAGSGGTP